MPDWTFLMSSDEPTKPDVPSKPGAYRTRIPAGGVAPTPAAKPAAVKTEPAKPSTTPETQKDSKDESRPDPTRFGDWEIKGRCIDF